VEQTSALSFKITNEEEKEDERKQEQPELDKPRHWHLKTQRHTGTQTQQRGCILYSCL
jgi:hypothetical protein